MSPFPRNNDRCLRLVYHSRQRVNRMLLNQYQSFRAYHLEFKTWFGSTDSIFMDPLITSSLSLCHA